MAQNNTTTQPFGDINIPELPLKFYQKLVKGLEDYLKSKTSFVSRPDIEEKNPDLYKLHLKLHYAQNWIALGIGLITFILGLLKV